MPLTGSRAGPQELPKPLTPLPPAVFTPRVVGTAVARYNFAARDMRELSLREGDVVRIYSRVGGDRGWWKGETHGRVSASGPRASVETLLRGALGLLPGRAPSLESTVISPTYRDPLHAHAPAPRAPSHMRGRWGQCQVCSLLLLPIHPFCVPPQHRLHCWGRSHCRFTERCSGLSLAGRGRLSTGLGRVCVCLCVTDTARPRRCFSASWCLYVSVFFSLNYLSANIRLGSLCLYHRCE